MVKILYFKITGELEESLLQSYLGMLPVELRVKALKYRRWQDQYTNIFGKLLLLYGLKSYGYPKDCLEQLQYNHYGKPFINAKTFFNLSHSGKIVICAFSDEEEIGIDIEEMNTIDIWEFDNTFTPEELDIMQSSADTQLAFYTYWTIKESVIKAIGKGLSIRLPEVIVSGPDHCRFWELDFNIRVLPIHHGYFCSLAVLGDTDCEVTELTLSDFNELKTL